MDWNCLLKGRNIEVIPHDRNPPLLAVLRQNLPDPPKRHRAHPVEDDLVILRIAVEAVDHLLPVRLLFGNSSSNDDASKLADHLWVVPSNQLSHIQDVLPRPNEWEGLRSRGMSTRPRRLSQLGHLVVNWLVALKADYTFCLDSLLWLRLTGCRVNAEGGKRCIHIGVIS